MHSLSPVGQWLSLDEHRWLSSGERHRAESLPEKLLRHRPTPHPAPLKHGLQMHRLPHRPSFDILLLQCLAHRMRVRSKHLRLDQNNGQPAIGLPVPPPSPLFRHIPSF